MKIVIIKYNAGNIFSVRYAVKRVGFEAEITDDPAVIRAADRVIFPGVGEAGTTMQYLRERGMDELIRSLTQPVLGICIGMQLMCRHSEESDTDCLGIFDTPVELFVPPEPNPMHYKVPHMGWNTLEYSDVPLFQGLGSNPYVYFVHSYHPTICEHTVAVTDHIVPFSSALQKDNFYALQFHPEKSGEVGARILHRFITMRHD